MKVIIVGGVAGGASCAARLRRLDEGAEIVMVERGPCVSYANCGLPYHISGVIGPLGPARLLRDAHPAAERVPGANHLRRHAVASDAVRRDRPGSNVMERLGTTNTRTNVSANSALAATLALPSVAHASFLPPEMMDSAAMGLAWFILCFVPIGGIVLFWLVHVMPEKIAHKRHHPQRDAIHTLCLLSLVFGGLLWPIAWLWAYVKPVGYRAAYGTEKHEDYFHEMGEKAQAGALLEHDLAHLRDELDAMAAKGTLTAELKVLRRDLAAAAATPAPVAPMAAPPAPAGAGGGNA